MSLQSSRLWLSATAGAVLLLLPGCVDTSGTSVKINGSIDTGVAVSHRSEASPRGAAVSFASVDGPPAAVAARFAQQLAAAASEREISIAGAKQAHYFARGYLTARPSAEGTEVAYVWDVFDAGQHRAGRLTNAVTLAGTADDPWSLVDEKVLAEVAGRSAEDLAAFLATTPEAVAFAAQGREGPATAAAETLPAAARPLSYAAE